MKKKKTVFIVFLLFFMVFTPACRHNPLHVKITGINVSLSVKRFEKDLFSMDTVELEQKIPVLSEEYGLFLKRFGEVIHIGESDSPSFSRYLVRFISDTLIRDVYEKTMEVFPDFDNLDGKLTKSFRYYRYYFPEKPVPAIITYISGFNASLMIDQGFLGIGLDRYLGEGTGYYDRLGIPKYMQRKMVPQKIPSDCMYALASTDFPFYPVHTDSVPIPITNNVISHMIYEGKLIYFVKAMMPDEKDEVILGFTPEQLKWCKVNEGQMWAYLIEKKLLFSTEYMTVNKLTRDAPFTSYFPRESPGKAANWIGWQIVNSFMSRNPGISLKELMLNYDYQKILDESGYSPE